MKSMNISIGQFSVPVLSTVPETLCCLLCSQILNNPHQGPCGCRFCFKCIDEYLKLKDTICPGKTKECVEVTLNIDRDLHPDNFARREMNKLIVKCPLNLCGKESELYIIKDHLVGCALSIVSCSMCEDLITRGEYSEHLINDCKESIVNCDSCHSTMKRLTLLEEHHNFEHENLCLTYTGFCPNNCGENDLVVWSEHRRICSNKYVSCPYQHIGCSLNSTTMKSMSKHMTDNGFHHAEILLKHIDNLNNEIAYLNASLVKVSTEKTALINKYCEGDEQQNQNLQMASINDVLNNMKQDVRITPALRNMIKEEITSSMRCTNNLFFTSIDRLNTEMKSIKLELCSTKPSPIKELYMPHNFQEKLPVKKNIQREKVLNWKILDFNRLHSLISPNFYTEQKGYKMSLSMEKKKKGYLSIYVQLKHGEYDAELSWPFRKCVTIRIIDQSNLGRDYEKFVIFNEKAGSVCDRKYFSETGDFGYSKFIAYDELRQRPYLLINNILLIHCFVDELKST